MGWLSIFHNQNFLKNRNSVGYMLQPLSRGQNEGHRVNLWIQFVYMAYYKTPLVFKYISQFESAYSVFAQSKLFELCVKGPRRM